MAFAMQAVAANFERFEFPEMAEIPEGEWVQGFYSSSDNPRRSVHSDGFDVSTGLVTVKDYKRYVRHAQTAGRYGVFGRVKDRDVKQDNEGDEILMGRGHHRKDFAAMRLFNPRVNEDLSLDDLEGLHIKEIAPELDWLDLAIRRLDEGMGLGPLSDEDGAAFFRGDNTPVAFVSQWDAYAYVAFLNQELARLRQAVHTRQIDEASLTQADRLLLTGGWFDLPTAAQLQRVMAGPDRNFVFGTEDGQPLNMQGRPFPHIGPALEQDTGVQWGDKRVRHTFGVLWQRTKDRYDVNSNKPSRDGSVIHNPRGAREGYPELSGGGSWDNFGPDRSVFKTIYRSRDDSPEYRLRYIGLRVVRPSTPK